VRLTSPPRRSDSFSSAYKGSLEKLGRRATFDLGCPAEELTYKDLGQFIGVAGCGKQATYKATEIGWVMNYADGAAPPAE
jgi:hypothetical protein